MSYCRWSSDDFRCDLYCYADIGGGYTTYVAKVRFLGADHSQTVAIGLPHDGETFNDPDLPSLLTRIMSLVALGYHAPAYTIQRIRAEIAAQEGV